MKVVPPPPPDLNNAESLALKIYAYSPGGPIDSIDKGEYLHWDKLRHREPPLGLTSKSWWFLTKFARSTLYKVLPFTDKFGHPFLLAMPNIILQKLHAIDRSMSNNIQSTLPLNPQMRDTYFVRSLTEEAITSSQLEGASTTRNVAKELLRTGRKPRDISEQMIFNNYQAMQFILENKKEHLTPSIVFELHRILTKETMESPESSGCFRTEKDDIHVFDNRDGELLHTPPKPEELEDRLKKLCQFANTTFEQDKFFIHPIVRAILLHFMLAYDHPFVDGNGRTARALFYWSMAQQGYWPMEFISISQILKKSPSKYGRAFLYTETDQADVTYFILHQLEVIEAAIKELHRYLERKAEEISATEHLLHTNQTLQDKLNYRQINLIKHALKHPHTRYQIEGHRQSHKITYDTARNDLLNLAKLGLLIKQKTGKAFTFLAPANLKQKIETV